VILFRNDVGGCTDALWSLVLLVCDLLRIAEHANGYGSTEEAEDAGRSPTPFFGESGDQAWKAWA
jgi:hypothetical protein